MVKRHKAQIRDLLAVYLSDIEVSRFKRMRKSAVNTLFVFFVFLLCYLPFFVTTAINNISKSSNTSVVLPYEFSVTLMLSNSSLNPLMYCMGLRDFRTAVKKTYKGIFCFASEEAAVTPKLKHVKHNYFPSIFLKMVNQAKAR